MGMLKISCGKLTCNIAMENGSLYDLLIKMKIFHSFLKADRGQIYMSFMSAQLKQEDLMAMARE